MAINDSVKCYYLYFYSISQYSIEFWGTISRAKTVFRIQNVYGSQHRITTAKFMFLSYQKPSCKLYFSRTRALKNKAVLGLAKKNLVIITQLGFSVELTPINSYFGMGSQIPNYVKKLVYYH